MAKKPIKTVEEAVNDVVNPVVMLQGIKITLDEYSRIEAKEMMEKRGLPIPWDFEGPDFKDILGYQLSPELLLISLKDGTSYVYPMRNVARIKHYNYEQAKEVI